jgi:glycosyltransferase involved in cell wall biosynthesis
MTSATVCLIVKNEAPYLIEWLAHYLCLGFDQILVYDNESSDGTAGVVEACARVDSRIILRSWPDKPGRIPQASAYMDAVATTQTEWVACFDADEFLVLHEDASIGAYLSRFGDDAGAVAINWLLFGSGGEELFRDEWQAVRFRACADNRRDSKNGVFKSIVRRKDAMGFVGHRFKLSRGHYVDDAGQVANMISASRTASISHRFAQLNHYVVRSRAEFDDKRARGNPARPAGHRDKYAYRNDAFWRDHDTNQRSDAAIDAWFERAAPLRAKLQEALAAKCTIPYSRGPRHPAGWYMLTAPPGPHTSALSLRLVAAAGDACRRTLVPRRNGSVRQVLALDQEVVHWSLEADGETRVATLRPLGRVKAAVVMVATLLRERRLSGLTTVARAVARGRFDQASAVLRARYEAVISPASAQ